MQQLAKVFLGLVFLLLVAMPAAWSDSAENTNHAGIVVDYGNGVVESACVAFTESTISGYDLLSRSGLNLLVDVYAQGVFVCSINNVGCPVSSCNECDGSNFWYYTYLSSNQWQGYQTGASDSTIEDGDVDGWAWGAAVPPLVASFEQICSAEINTPTPSPTVTNTPLPSLTPTPSATPTTAILPTKIVPTNTPTPRVTNTTIPTQPPTNTPTATATPSPTPAQSETATATATSTTAPTNTSSEPTSTPTATVTNTPTATETPDSAETEAIVATQSQPTATQPPTATPIIVPTSTPRPVTTSAPEESQAAAPTATPSPQPTQPLPTATSSAISTIVPPTLELREPLGEAPTGYEEVASTPESVVPTTPVEAVAISAETSASPTPIAIALAEPQPQATPEPIIFDPPGAGNGAVAARVIGADANLAAAFIPAAIQPAPANPSQLSIMLPYLIFATIVATLTLLILLAGRTTQRRSR